MNNFLQKINTRFVNLKNFRKNNKYISLKYLDSKIKSIKIKKIYSNISFKNLYLSFIIITTIYIGFVAKKRFSVTSEFIVQTKTTVEPITQNSFGLGQQNNIIINSIQDGMFLRSFLKSEKVYLNVYPSLNNLIVNSTNKYNKKINIYSKENNIEKNLNRFKKKINISLDPSSGIIKLKTYSFNPQIALDLNNLLLEESKNFVNSINQKITTKQNKFLSKQLKDAEDRLNNSLYKLNEFKDNNNILNFTIERDSLTQYISNLQNRLVDLKVEYASLRNQYLDPMAPELVYVNDQIKELSKQIREEQSSISKDSNSNINLLSSELKLLETEVEFAQQMHTTAKTSFEMTRLNSQKDMKFMIIINNPFLPNQQSSFWRIRTIILLNLLLLLFIIIKEFIFSTLKRHNN